MTTDKQQLPSKEVLQEAYALQLHVEYDEWWDNATKFQIKYGVMPQEIVMQAAQYVLTNHDELGGRE